jgi:molybdopterin converting factor small subunit
MKIKVKVDSNLKIKNVFEPPLELELKDDENTLKDVLGKLAERYPYLRFIEKGEMGDDLRHLYVNGQSHFSFSEGLKKELTEGDTVLVEAYMDPLAGG